MSRKVKMRFVPTVDLWDAGTIRAIENGQLRLQPGQWVQCGEGRKSRLVRINPLTNTVWAAHPKTTKGRDSAQYAYFLAATRGLRIA